MSDTSVPQDRNLLRVEFRPYLLFFLLLSFFLFLDITVAHSNPLNFEIQLIDELTASAQVAVGCGLFERLTYG